MIQVDTFAGNRVIAAQALGRCGDPDMAFEAIYREARQATHGYVYLQALNAFQYSHTDERLTLHDWQAFQQGTSARRNDLDAFGETYAQRIVTDALALWPERRRVE